MCSIMMVHQPRLLGMLLSNWISDVATGLNRFLVTLPVSWLLIQLWSSYVHVLVSKLLYQIYLFFLTVLLLQFINQYMWHVFFWHVLYNMFLVYIKMMFSFHVPVFNSLFSPLPPLDLSTNHDCTGRRQTIRSQPALQLEEIERFSVGLIQPAYPTSRPLYRVVLFCATQRDNFSIGRKVIV